MYIPKPGYMPDRVLRIIYERGPLTVNECCSILQGDRGNIMRQCITDLLGNGALFEVDGKLNMPHSLRKYYADKIADEDYVKAEKPSAAMKSDTWLTPPEIIRALGHFDLDPCCPPLMPWPTAERMVCKEQDGLAIDWHGRVFLNPPYSKEAVKWLRKLAEHGCGTALVFARTETSWFFETVWRAADAVLFLEGRIHFHLADGTRAKANAGAPSCLVAYGQHDALVLRDCCLAGHYVRIK